jgi:hypothetical protein
MKDELEEKCKEEHEVSCEVINKYLQGLTKGLLEIP